MNKILLLVLAIAFTGCATVSKVQNEPVTQELNWEGDINPLDFGDKTKWKFAGVVKKDRHGVAFISRALDENADIKIALVFLRHDMTINAYAYLKGNTVHSFILSSENSYTANDLPENVYYGIRRLFQRFLKGKAV